jgi:stress-induced morphogen
MFRAEAIKELIETALTECTAQVFDDANDGQHFRAEVVAAEFEGLSLVKQHQLVYGALGDHMKSDIHALALKTYTPTRWENR